MKTRVLFFSVLGVVLLFFASWIYFYKIVGQEAKPKIDKVVTVEKKPDIEITGTTLRENEKNGKPIWQISAQKLLAYKEQKEIVFEGVQIEFYKDSQKVLEAKAKMVTVDWQKRDLLIRGGIFAAKNTNVSFAADNTRWDAAQRKLFASGNVNFQREKMFVTGERLISDIAGEKVVLEGKVKMKGLSGL